MESRAVSSAEKLPAGLIRASNLATSSEGEGFRDSAVAETPPEEALGAAAYGELSAARVVELRGNARLTLSVLWVAGAQDAGEAVVWIAGKEEEFFAPDLAENGVELSALPVIRVRRREECVEAIDTVMRSGFFSLVVVDWNGGWQLEGALQNRFFRLGRRHGVSLLFLGDEGSPLPLVPLRVEANRSRRSPGNYVIEIEVVRDKLGVRLPRQEVAAHGPAGLR